MYSSAQRIHRRGRWSRRRHGLRWLQLALGSSGSSVRADHAAGQVVETGRQCSQVPRKRQASSCYGETEASDCYIHSTPPAGGIPSHEVQAQQAVSCSPTAQASQVWEVLAHHWVGPYLCKDTGHTCSSQHNTFGEEVQGRKQLAPRNTLQQVGDCKEQSAN